jgi:hypothetical protein
VAVLAAAAALLLAYAGEKDAGTDGNQKHGNWHTKAAIGGILTFVAAVAQAVITFLLAKCRAHTVHGSAYFVAFFIFACAAIAFVGTLGGSLTATPAGDAEACTEPAHPIPDKVYTCEGHVQWAPFATPLLVVAALLQLTIVVVVRDARAVTTHECLNV